MSADEPVDWQVLAERIGARHRGRDSLIRGVAVVGDYARNQVWAGSVLHIVLFRHHSEALIDEGAVTQERDISVTVDSITSGYFVEIEQRLHIEPLAGQLADLHALRLADPTLREVLSTFRDRYYSAEGRQHRAARALQRARVALDDGDATQRPFFAIDALRNGIMPAASAVVGEPVDLLRLPRRLRAAGRLLRLANLWPGVEDALQLQDTDLEQRWTSAEALYSLARVHLEARLPEVGAALVPRLERALTPARAASQALSDAGDPAAAAWTAINAAAEIDAIIEAAAPGWRERSDYAQRAASIYADPQRAALRRICVALNNKLG